MTVAGAAAQQKSLSPEKRAQIEKAVSSFMSANSRPRHWRAVVVDGEPVWSAGFGMSDWKTMLPPVFDPLPSGIDFQTDYSGLPSCSSQSGENWTSTRPYKSIVRHFPRKEWPITAREPARTPRRDSPLQRGRQGDIPEDSARHFSSMEESLQIFAGDPLVTKRREIQLLDLRLYAAGLASSKAPRRRSMWIL